MAYGDSSSDGQVVLLSYTSGIVQFGTAEVEPACLRTLNPSSTSP